MSATAKLILDVIERDGELSMEGALVCAFEAWDAGK